VARSDGTAERVPMHAVRKGDGLIGAAGQISEVRCVVKTACAGHRALLTQMPNGLQITEWHPLWDASARRWRFPNLLGAPMVVSTPFVYNFVLAPGHPTILVDGIECAALGHGLQGAVIAHPYWGTDAVLQDLARLPGWEEGCVVMGGKEAI